MPFPRKTAAVTIATDSNGDATDYTEVFTGRIVGVIYTKVDYADGVVLLITTEDTGQTVWSETAVNASETLYPRIEVQDNLGAALLHSSDAANVDQTDYIRAVFERVKIVIASGGNVKTGTFTVIYE